MNGPVPTSVRVSWLMTVSTSRGSGTMCSQLARKLMPRKRTAKSKAIQLRVMRALLFSGA